jgi:hypothetical protein
VDASGRNAYPSSQGNFTRLKHLFLEEKARKRACYNGCPKGFGQQKAGFKQVFENPFFSVDIIFFLPFR